MNIERQIEFDKVKELWKELAVTDWAVEKISQTALCFSETDVKKMLRDTSDARFLIEKLGTPPLQNITEIREVLQAVEKGDCYLIDTDVTVYQADRDNHLIPTATIMDSSDPVDHRVTKITCGGKTLTFRAAYDGPIHPHFIWHFMNEKGCSEVTLHCFAMISQHYLCYENQYFLAKRETKDNSRITVYNAFPVPTAAGTQPSVLAKIVRSEIGSGEYTYEIQFARKVPGALFMAILALPFALYW